MLIFVKNLYIISFFCYNGLGRYRKVKRNLLKAIGISFLIYVILSWIIPVGTYSGKLSTSGIDPVGLGDLFGTPISAFITFILYGVVIAIIGGFYGVVEKTGAFDKVVDRMVRRFENKSNMLLVITVILFTVLSSLTGLVIPLFVLVPLFGAVLLKLNYDKVTVLAATVGSLLLGNVTSTYGFNISGYTKNILSLDMNFQIVVKIILLICLTLLFIFTILFLNKNHNKEVQVKEAKIEEPKKEIEEKEEVKKTTRPVKKSSKSKSVKRTTKKVTTKALAITGHVKKVRENRGIAFVVVLVLTLLVAFVSMYNWYYSFGISLFSDVYSTVMGVKIKDFAIFEKLFGGISQFGYWSNVDFATLLVFVSMFIAFIYKMSINDYVESFIAGVKKWLPTAIYAALASVILAVLYKTLSSGTGNMIITVYAKIFDTVSGFNPIIVGIASLLGSFFYNDLYYLLSGLNSFISEYSASDLSLAGYIIQSVYGIGMMIFPTSVMLIAGLSLFDVTYKDWIKYIWKFALISLLFILLVCGIVTLL